jgi:hypothetical protein
MQMAKDLFLLKKSTLCFVYSKKNCTFARFLYGGDYALVPKNGCGRP